MLRARSPALRPLEIALVNTGLFPGAAIMQPAFGWALDLTWDRSIAEDLRRYAWSDYRNGLWLWFGLGLLAAIAGRRALETYCRNIGSEIG